MPEAEPQRNLKELARIASEVYDRQVRPALRPENDGKFVAVDIETGDYEVDKDDYTALMQLRSRRPAAAEIWLMRAGYPTTYDMRGVR
jgi:hypothetical protein